MGILNETYIYSEVDYIENEKFMMPSDMGSFIYLNECRDDGDFMVIEIEELIKLRNVY